MGIAIAVDTTAAGISMDFDREYRGESKNKFSLCLHHRIVSKKRLEEDFTWDTTAIGYGCMLYTKFQLLN